MKNIIFNYYYRKKTAASGKKCRGCCGGGAPAEGVAQDRRAGWRAGEGFPLLYKNLRSQIEEREEDIYAAKEHDDVAEEVHEFDLLEVVEDEADEVENSAENQHAEAFCGKNFKEVFGNYQA